MKKFKSINNLAESQQILQRPYTQILLMWAVKILKKLHFEITTSRNEVIDFQAVPIQFSLLFQLDN